MQAGRWFRLTVRRRARRRGDYAIISDTNTVALVDRSGWSSKRSSKRMREAWPSSTSCRRDILTPPSTVLWWDAAAHDVDYAP